MNLFTDYEQRLFTRVVALAEKQGKSVDLVVVPSNNIFDAIAQTAQRLDSAEIITGQSAKLSAQEQERELGKAWERLPEHPRRQVCLKIIQPDNKEHSVYLGAHAPSLSEEDISLVHDIWLDVVKIRTRSQIHHRDVVRVALQRLRRDLRGQSDVMLDFYKIEHENGKEKSIAQPASDEVPFDRK